MWLLICYTVDAHLPLSDGNKSLFVSYVFEIYSQMKYPPFHLNNKNHPDQNPTFPPLRGGKVGFKIIKT